MATTNHVRARRPRGRNHRSLIRMIVSEWTVVVVAHVVAVLVLTILDELLRISPCAR